ncbi:MAG: ABC transporter substrate-binding protein [Sphingobium sp.]|uniref:ABC transporter substrate-binding protein n=1 Tax=Sphingobium sp. TaxID=1912891 RepID=UPI0029A915FE|nr:ABC transporter substrate-binding protein [Sphingobium sp.]MDX3908265.1 ABC transporter substrate-binding protein [Sphingobium sp.]
MKRLLLILPLMILTASAPPAALPPPKHIMSLNLCADQLLLALADRSQVVALTPLARDTAMSAEAARAKAWPVAKGSAETLLALKPDLVISSPYYQIPPQAKGNFRQLSLADATSYSEIVTQVRQVAAAVGHPGRGETLIARMNAELAAIPRPTRHPVAAYYQRRGYMTGTGTLVDDMMQRVGLRNLAAVLGKPVLSRLTLEEMVVARPDYLIVETATDTVPDKGTEMLHHPALKAMARLRLPEAWTVCGSPAYVRAAQSLAKQLRR